MLHVLMQYFVDTQDDNGLSLCYTVCILFKGDYEI